MQLPLKITSLKLVTNERSVKLCLLTVRSLVSYRTVVALVLTVIVL